MNKEILRQNYNIYINKEGVDIKIAAGLLRLQRKDAELALLQTIKDIILDLNKEINKGDFKVSDPDKLMVLTIINNNLDKLKINPSYYNHIKKNNDINMISIMVTMLINKII